MGERGSRPAPQPPAARPGEARMDPAVGQGLLGPQPARPRRGGQGEGPGQGWGLSTPQDPARVHWGCRTLSCPTREPQGVRLFKN